MEIIIHEKLDLIFFFILDLIHRLYKWSLHKLTGRHEIQRICESKLDIYSKSFSIENWLIRTSSSNINQVVNKYYQSESNDQLIRKDSMSALCEYRIFQLGYTLSRLDNRQKSGNEKVSNLSLDTVDFLIKHIDLYVNGPVTRSLHASKILALNDTYEVIIKEKNMYCNASKSLLDLKDAIYRIYTYRQVQFILDYLASIKYNSNDNLHAARLISFWNCMMPHEPIDYSDDLVSNRWLRIGFQGEDPGTDFRGMGLLSLINLEYLARHRNAIAKNLMTNNVTPNYPFAIVGINLTFTLFKFIKNGHLKHFFYDDQYFKCLEKCNVLMLINELYVELFIRFDCYWNQRAPQSIMEFNSVLGDFSLIIQEDLKQHNFFIKFIYSE